MASLPSTMRKIIVKSLSSNFREAIEIQTCSLPKLQKNQALVKHRYVGINASDVNFSAGKYTPGQKPPFGAGFEAAGEVVAIGDEVPTSLIGQPVINMNFGAFSEYQAVPAATLFPIKKLSPAYLPCLVSGMTAKLALDNCGFLQPNEKVLVTAAAGGTGQFAVQFAKLAGCHVIGTCSTDKKVEFLKSIGCDHAINVSKQDLNTELKKAYPDGVDVVYESVGGETYEVCVNRLALKGRLIVIGYISGYQDAMGVASSKYARSAAALPVKLLMKSATVRGFFLFHFAKQWKGCFSEIAGLYDDGKIQCAVDLGKNVTSEGFLGIEGIAEAVDYLYTKKSIGKVVVDLQGDTTSSKL